MFCAPFYLIEHSSVCLYSRTKGHLRSQLMWEVFVNIWVVTVTQCPSTGQRLQVTWPEQNKVTSAVGSCQHVCVWDDRKTAGSTDRHRGLLIPAESEVQITAVDTIVHWLLQRQACVSHFCSYLVWYWFVECETKANGRVRSLVGGGRSVKPGVVCVWMNTPDSFGWADMLTASLCLIHSENIITALSPFFI